MPKSLLTTSSRKFITYTIVSIILLGLAIAIYLVQRTQKILPFARPSPPTSLEYRLNGRTISRREVDALRNYFAYVKNLPPGERLNEITEDFLVSTEALRTALERRGVSLDQFVKCQNVITPSDQFACGEEMAEYAKVMFLDKRNGMYFMVRFDSIIASSEDRAAQARERSAVYKELLETELAQSGANPDSVIDALIAEANSDPIIQSLNYGNNGGDGARRLTQYTRNATDTFADPSFNVLVFSTRPGTVSTTQTLRYTKTGQEYGYVWVYIQSAQNSDPTAFDYNRWLQSAKQNITVEKHVPVN